VIINADLNFSRNIDISKLPAGVYSVQLVTDNETLNQRVVKENN
jgi:hypothetical protein